MRNLDSCRCWRCTLCPCKVRNKYLVNFWNRTILLCIPCICNKMQLYTVYLYLETALYVSGGTSTHHQERFILIISLYIIPIYIQQDATLHSLFISGNCSICFGWYFHPSSGAHTTVSTALGFSYRASFKYYDKGYQQMPLSFVIFLYLHVSSLHVSGFYQPIIRGIPSCCLFVATWFI